MEQPFLPAEVSLLVLRYLAGIGCKETARCFYKEFPNLKDVIQLMNRGNETPNHRFGGPPVLGALPDILYDYGRAKLIMKNIVVELLNNSRALSEDSISPCDTLATQLRQIGILLDKTFPNRVRFSTSSRESTGAQLPPSKSIRDADTQTATEICTKRTASASTCTSLDIPESQNIVVMTVKKLCNEETQTDLVAEKELEPPSVQSDDGAEVIPYMFYNNLLNNTGLQKMIASNINQQFVGSGTQNEKEEVVKTVSSKAEREIDNFLAELLQAEENSQGGFSYSWNNGPAEFDAIELPNLGIPTQNENSSTLNTPAKASPVKEAQTQEVESLEEEVRAKSTPQSKSPGNAQKANSRPSLNTTTTTVTLSPSSLSARQRLGRRNTAPKIPVATGTVRTPIPLVAAQPISHRQVATPSTAHEQEVLVLAKKSLPDRNESFAPTPTVVKENQVKISESGNIVSIQAGTEFEPLNFKEQVKRHDKLSPLIQPLMASAQKFRQATTFDLEKKSFSTPRKKKHVRNLMFTSPPKLSKQTTKASLYKSNFTQNYAKGDKDLSQSVPLTRKRKAESIENPKSRKCLDLSFEQPKTKRANDVKVKEEPLVTTGSRKSTRNQQRISNHKDYATTIESVIQQPLRNDTDLVSQKNGKTCPLDAKRTETPPEKGSPVDPKQKKVLIASKVRGESTSKPIKISVCVLPSPRKKKSKSKRSSSNISTPPEPPKCTKTLTKGALKEVIPISPINALSILTYDILPELPTNFGYHPYPSPTPYPAIQPLTPKLFLLNSNEEFKTPQTPGPLIRSEMNSNPPLSSPTTRSQPLRPKTPDFQFKDSRSIGTSFLRPPTPRIHKNLIDDGDYWESSDGDISLILENNGIYPINLLWSSPLPTGIPRTPGRQTPSSARTLTDSVESHPYFTAQRQSDSADLLAVCSPKEAISVPVPVPTIRTQSHESCVNEQERCAVTSTSQEITRGKTPSPAHAEDSPPISSPDPVIFRQRIQFQVAGQTKKLSFSAQQSLFDLNSRDTD